jgi:pilus assembly protein FimV
VALSASESDDFREQAAVSFGSTSPVAVADIDHGHGADNSVDAPLPDLNFRCNHTRHPDSQPDAASNQPEAADSGMLEFDLGTLSLELETPCCLLHPSPKPEDPLATKLALAEEFVSIGDDDGARALIEEVIAEASGDLKAKAQRALSSLG